MKIECVTEKLQEVIERVQNIPAKNTTLPLIQNIYLEAKGTTLLIRATNLEVSVEVFLSVKIEKEGVILVSGDIFPKLINSLIKTNKKTTLELIDTTLHVISGQIKTSIKTFTYEDFPTLPNILQNSLSCELKTTQILEGIKSVYYSAASSDLKPEIASVYIYTTDTEIVFVSTDSFRLAEKRIKTKITTPFNIIIPIKNIGDIIKLLSVEKGDCTLYFNKNTIYIQTEGVHISSRIIDAVFPNYQLIIPKETTTKTTVLKEDITTTLKGLSLFSDRFNQTSLRIDPEKKQCVFSSKNQDIGEGEYSIDASIQGDEVLFNFNYRYLQEALPIFYKESIVIECTTAQKPVLIKSVADQTFLYLIMPLR